MDLIAMIVGYAVLSVMGLFLLMFGATWLAYRIGDFLNRTIEVSE